MQMIITIDFDLTNYREQLGETPRDRSELETLIFLFKVNYLCMKNKCKICLTKKGIHVYIYNDVRDARKRINTRRWLGDDEIRMDADMKRIKDGLGYWTDTLFKEKIEDGETYREMCMDFRHFFNEYIARL